MTEAGIEATVSVDPKGGTPRLSYSRLSSYSKCPEAYRLKWIQHVEPEPSGAAIAGGAIHQIIEELLIGERWYRGGGADLRERLNVAFAVAFGAALWEATKDVPCPAGCDNGHAPLPCPGCGGAGTASLQDAREVPCGSCDGSGMFDQPCQTCEGSGTVTIRGEHAVRWGGRKRIAVDVEGNRIKDPADPTGKTYLKTGEDVPWWAHEGPIMLMRAAAILKGWEELGVEVTGARVEVEVTAWLYDPWIATENGQRVQSRPSEHPDWPDGIQITGRIDAMLVMVPEGEHVDPETGELLPGTWAICDWKSGTFLDDAPFQMVVYAWLIHNTPDPRQFFDVRVGYVVNLRGKTPDRQLLIEHFTDSRLAFVPQRFERMAAGIRAGLFDWKPSSFCGSCWVRRECLYWKVEGKEPA